MFLIVTNGMIDFINLVLNSAYRWYYDSLEGVTLAAISKYLVVNS